MSEEQGLRKWDLLVLPDDCVHFLPHVFRRLQKRPSQMDYRNKGCLDGGSECTGSQDHMTSSSVCRLHRLLASFRASLWVGPRPCY